MGACPRFKGIAKGFLSFVLRPFLIVLSKAAFLNPGGGAKEIREVSCCSGSLEVDRFGNFDSILISTY